jgi:hypothetical protein
MKFCPVVPEICCGQVHGPRKERRRKRRIKRSNSAFLKCLPFSQWLPKHGIKYGR